MMIMLWDPTALVVGSGLAAPPSGQRQRQQWATAREHQWSAKGKLRLVLCKLKYRNTKTVRVANRDKL